MCIFSGQVVSWGERCRIKHLPTRQYLAVVKGKSGTNKVHIHTKIMCILVSANRLHTCVYTN